MRAMHDLGASDRERGPSWQDLHTVYSQTVVCRAFRMHGAHILPKPAHFGYMARISCPEPALFPSEATFGMHEAKKLSRMAARERTAAESCHGRHPENAPWLHLAMAAPSRMLLDDILPRRPSAARACREIAVAPRSRKTPPERSVGQFNNARRHVQETMKIFWCLSPRNGTENVLA